jgi:membrane-bound ClpP family serine protease
MFRWGKHIHKDSKIDEPLPMWHRPLAYNRSMNCLSPMTMLLLTFISLTSATMGNAQETGNATANPQSVAPSRQAVLIELPTPLNARAIERVLSQLSQLAVSARDSRVTVVLKFGGDDASGQPETGAAEGSASATELEDALRLARAISGSDLKRIRPVAWVDATVRGYETLVVLGCETVVVSPNASIGVATGQGNFADDTTKLIFQSIAKRRALLPEPVVAALVDSDLELAQIVVVGGEQKFATGSVLESARQSGEVLEESIWSPAFEPLTLSANRLRELQAATAIVSDENEVADRLGVSGLRRETSEGSEDAVGVYVRINGTINPQRVRRWQTNLAATTEKGETNTWLIEVDSPGGNLAASASLAAVMSDPGASVRSVGGYVSRQARGDAVLLALACRPLSLHPEATLGGSGADAMTSKEVSRFRELISIIASATNRSETLIRGLLDPSLAVHRYVSRQTGRVRYAVPSELSTEFKADPANEGADVSAVWKREDRIELAEGVSAETSVELGLADGIVKSLPAAAAMVGLSSVPPQLADRGLVRFVERIGRNDGLAFGLLLIGFMLLSTEASAPGLGLPGFLSMLCFAFFFWTKFLAGTAEWAELLAFGLGIACLAIEVFVLPGFGVFGIGGLVLTVLGVVLMSQTFVIPRNAYQAGELLGGIWMVLGSMVGLLIGFVAVRAFLPQAATAAGLAMEVPESSLEDFERTSNYDHLTGQTGVAATRLRPSGKARFGDLLVSVVSDGSSLEPGQDVRVVQVLGSRIVVEAVES